MLRKLAFVLVGVALLAGLGWRFVTHWTPSRTTFPTQGIDVSQEQGLIDWKAARAAGVDFAYIRASQGSDRRDENFAANWSESAAADVKRGAYHVFNLCKQGREQATNFIALVPREADALPHALDLEFEGNCAARPPRDTLLKELVERIKKAYALKESVEDQAALGGLERYIVINAIDHHWQEHLTEMEELRRSIGLRSYGQKDPLSEYKSEAFRFFEELMNNVRLQICTSLFRSATNRDAFENLFAILSRSARLQGPAAAPTALGAAAQADVGGVPSPRESDAAPAEEIKLPSVTIRREAPKVGRNDPCPCGSGKKSKNCHGAG